MGTRAVGARAVGARAVGAALGLLRLLSYRDPPVQLSYPAPCRLMSPYKSLASLQMLQMPPLVTTATSPQQLPGIVDSPGIVASATRAAGTGSRPAGAKRGRYAGPGRAGRAGRAGRTDRQADRQTDRLGAGRTGSGRTGRTVVSGTSTVVGTGMVAGPGTSRRRETSSREDRIDSVDSIS
ncbi:MAG: hypothetical protein ACJ8DI_05130 [Ktedonobacteraceae bacterium]